MKLILARDNIKREICGPFELCGSAADLLSLRDQLSRILDDTAFSYGWITIQGEIPTVPTDTPPRKWTE